MTVGSCQSILEQIFPQECSAYLDTLPGATGTPLTPIVPANTWNTAYPLSPYPVVAPFVPHIIDINLR